MPFGQMQNAECKMQNECISFGNDLKSCRRHTIILHSGSDDLRCGISLTKTVWEELGICL